MWLKLYYCYSLVLVCLPVDEVLKRGHVPALPKNLVSRKLLVKQIRDKLSQLKDSDGWVVIHGLPGFGEGTVVTLGVYVSSDGCFLGCT